MIVAELFLMQFNDSNGEGQRFAEIALRKKRGIAVIIVQQGVGLGPSKCRSQQQGNARRHGPTSGFQNNSHLSTYRKPRGARRQHLGVRARRAALFFEAGQNIADQIQGAANEDAAGRFFAA